MEFGINAQEQSLSPHCFSTQDIFYVPGNKWYKHRVVEAPEAKDLGSTRTRKSKEIVQRTSLLKYGVIGQNR
jgi:hypothetical protein